MDKILTVKREAKMEKRECDVCEGEMGAAKVKITVTDLDGIIIDRGVFCLACARDAVKHCDLVIPTDEEFAATHEAE